MWAAGLLVGIALAAAPQANEARAVLDRAAAWHRSAPSVDGPARAEHVRRALALYRSLRERFPDERALAAEGAFRAGELLRAQGRAQDAELEFRVALEWGRETPFAARAAYELAHAARRAGRTEEALEMFRAVLEVDGASSTLRDSAALWAARACAELGRTLAARRLLERVALGDGDTVQRARAFDELARMRIAAGDLEAAAGELLRCRAALRAAALEESPRGARTRAALERMRSVGELERAIVRRRESVDIGRR